MKEVLAEEFEALKQFIIVKEQNMDNMLEKIRTKLISITFSSNI